MTKPTANPDSASSNTIETANGTRRTIRYQPIPVIEMILERASRSIRLRGEGDRATSLGDTKKADSN